MKIRPLHDRILVKREDEEEYVIMKEEDVLAILE